MPATLETMRRASQQAFVSGRHTLVVGSQSRSPWALARLKKMRDDDPAVVESISSGLTARVYRLRAQNACDFTLKLARPKALVGNVDGQTSFLNEVQRREDFERLKREPGGELRWQAIVDTVFASYLDGSILSPWIEGVHIVQWDERRLSQLLGLVCDLWVEGLFEWDLCGGNLLDDGQQIRLFDFGYMYRFDPLRHFNSAGHGDDQPLFHPAERFESRNFCAYLLQLEKQSQTAALDAFRLEKEVALDAYLRMRSKVAAQGAKSVVLDWLAGITRGWAEALHGDASSLYLSENWRSHALDLYDDLSGKSCTPMTLLRADWLLCALRENGDALRAQHSFFWDDEPLDQKALIARYTALRQQAVSLQLTSHD
jgi:hypothetical protein